MARTEILAFISRRTLLTALFLVAAFMLVSVNASWAQEQAQNIDLDVAEIECYNLDVPSEQKLECANFVLNARTALRLSAAATSYKLPEIAKQQKAAAEKQLEGLKKDFRNVWTTGGGKEKE